MYILITRPYESSIRLAAHLNKMGHKTIVDPLIHIMPLPVHLPSLDSFRAIITTSQQAIRCLAGLTPYRHFPLWCVGSESAKVAKNLGFRTIYTANGSGNDLMAKLLSSNVSTPHKPFLHLSGDVIRIDIVKTLSQKSIPVERLIVYETQEASRFSSETQTSLKAGMLDAVLFFSPRTAQTFQKLCQDIKLESMCASIRAICLSNSIKEEILTLPWKKIRVAKKTTTDDLLMTLMMAD